MKQLSIILLTTICIWIIIPKDKTPQPTKNDCIAYWTQRTSSWNNKPSAETIQFDSNFCGDVK